MPTDGVPPVSELLTELRFVYVGTDDTEGSVAFYTATIGGRLRWRFQRFGADVAGIELGAGPLLLLADHRPAGSLLPIWAVTDLAEAERRLTSAGCRVVGPLGSPEGNAILFADPDGAEWALLQVDRPDAMDGAYRDASNESRVVD